MCNTEFHISAESSGVICVLAASEIDRKTNESIVRISLQSEGFEPYFALDQKEHMSCKIIQVSTLYYCYYCYLVSLSFILCNCSIGGHFAQYKVLARCDPKKRVVTCKTSRQITPNTSTP